MLKELICSVHEAGLSNIVYYSFHVLGLLLALLVALNDAGHLKIKLWKAFVAVLVVYPIIYELRYAVRWFERLFYECDGANIVKAFIFLPFVIWPVAKLLGVKQCKINQLFAVIPCIGQGISHIGCIFPGCCEGYAASWGIYNYGLNCLCIPVQLFEAATALLIGLYLELRFRKNNWHDDKKALPIMFVLFGASRFLLEFCRNNDKIFLHISNPALHCLLMAIVGIVWLVLLKRSEKKAVGVRG